MWFVICGGGGFCQGGVLRVWGAVDGGCDVFHVCLVVQCVLCFLVCMLFLLLEMGLSLCHVFLESVSVWKVLCVAL